MTMRLEQKLICAASVVLVVELVVYLCRKAITYFLY